MSFIYITAYFPFKEALLLLRTVFRVVLWRVLHSLFSRVVGCRMLMSNDFLMIRWGVGLGMLSIYA